MNSAPYYAYWGKASRSDPEAYHLLPYHCLDVAAVMQTLLRRNPLWMDRIRIPLDVDEKALVRLLCYMAALHDIGKFSDDFQCARPDLLYHFRGVSSRAAYHIRHDALTALAWREIVWPVIWKAGWLCAETERDEYGWRDDVLGTLTGAAAGHHGKPVETREPSGVVARVETHFTPENRAAVEDFARTSASFLIATEAPLVQDSKGLPDNARAVSWLLAGLIVLADWIGSNQAFFPFSQDVMPLDEYWEVCALPRAENAVTACGVVPAAPSGRHGMSLLFPKISRPSPLQQLAERLPLGDGPQLIVIEDLTGAGKTEAALVLAQRLINSGATQGLYMGLPTMATANAMFKRIHEVHRRLFAEDETPSFVLAHSHRDLSRLFRKLRTSVTSAHDANEDEEDGALTGQAWLSDNRKKALLASVGVGTVDQALMAVLPAKHQSLRLLGLSRNVLIVDEVHACDTYMHRLLRGVLQFQAALGGSAILLSATLPRRMRRELVESFCDGLKESAPLLEKNGYPLLTHVRGAGEPEVEFEPRLDSPRAVQVRFVSQVEQVVATIKAAAVSGRCACWIRNTVQDAIEAVELLRAADLSLIDLFHARFAMGDRLETEERVLARFGETSRQQERAGRVVVATQVVEQSLDVDFDVMVTDLAPIDLIVQRSGRMCRHARDLAGNRVQGPDKRGTPRLCVLAPDFAPSPTRDWFKDFLPGAAAVYPNHGQLWLTAKLLAERGEIRTPDDARLLIEGVYGNDAQEAIPDALAGVQADCEGERMAQATIAEQNKLKLNDGYEKSWQNWLDDHITPTRLGEDSVTLRLARWDGSVLIPWFKAKENAWSLSDVVVRWVLVRSVCLARQEHEAVEASKATMPDQGRWSIIVPLRQDPEGRWSARILNARDKEVILRYNKNAGLVFEQFADEA